MNEKPTPYKTRIRKEIMMSKGNVIFEKDNEYFTPKWLVDYFGQFDYDPATTKEKALELNIKNFDTIQTDGLKSDWSIYNSIWINPPFSEKHKFIKKAYETFIKNPNINIYCLFPIEFLTTKRFHDIAKNVGGKIFLANRRIPFQSGLGKNSKSPAFGSVILKIQNKWEIELINLKGENYDRC